MRERETPRSHTRWLNVSEYHTNATASSPKHNRHTRQQQHHLFILRGTPAKAAALVVIYSVVTGQKQERSLQEGHRLKREKNKDQLLMIQSFYSSSLSFAFCTSIGSFSSLSVSFSSLPLPPLWPSELSHKGQWLNSNPYKMRHAFKNTLHHQWSVMV